MMTPSGKGFLRMCGQYPSVRSYKIFRPSFLEQMQKPLYSKCTPFLKNTTLICQHSLNLLTPWAFTIFFEPNYFIKFQFSSYTLCQMTEKSNSEGVRQFVLDYLISFLILSTLNSPRIVEPQQKAPWALRYASISLNLFLNQLFSFLMFSDCWKEGAQESTAFRIVFSVLAC